MPLTGEAPPVYVVHVRRSSVLFGALLFEHGVSRLEDLPAEAQREYTDALQAERRGEPPPIDVDRYIASGTATP